MHKLLILTLLLFTKSYIYAGIPKLYPANGSTDICIDTHLTIEFDVPVKVGNSGKVRVYDITTNQYVDSLDLSIPSGPTQSRTYAESCDYTKVPYDYSRTFIPTNRNTKPGTPSGTAEPTPPEYQLNIIGGFTDAFHFYPVIVNGNKATIYLHNNVLEYGHTYKVSIDREVLISADFKSVNSWVFKTKKSAPSSTTLYVSQSGKADFCTIQGALDQVPDFSSTPFYIYINKGDYEELVYTRNKTNLTICGAGMKSTRLHYANNEVFNPHPLTVKTNEWPGTFPSRRAAAMFDNCKDITLKDMTFATDLKGQAEGLLLNGEHIILDKVYIVGDGDALQANGTIYMNECEMDGGADAFLSRGSLYAYRCNLRNDGGPFTWVRNTKGHHGLVFVECTFSTNNGAPVDFGRCPQNKKSVYPYAEMVLINCKSSNTIPSGWSVIGEPTATYLDYNTRDLKTGKLSLTDERHKYSRKLDKIKDAKLIRNYSTPSFVLDGWTPKLK